MILEPSENTGEREVRIEKLEQLRQAGITPFAERYEKTHSTMQAKELPDGVKGVRLAGRVVGIRGFGKLTFGHLLDFAGKIQFAAQKNKLGESFTRLMKLVDVGDFIGVEGEVITTRTGEKTIDISEWTFLSKSLRPLPEKFHGMTDQELKYRRRYLDLITSPESMDRFKKRTRIIKTIRNFLDDNEFVEIDTPVLTNKACGALARPFVTHNNALDIDVFLRIAPETYLKRAITGGFERVYEFARSFRNEGVDASHLPDFTLLEYYCAYWNYEDNMKFTEKLFKHLLVEINGSLDLTYANTKISFDGNWPRISFRDLVLKDCGIDIDKFPTRDALFDEIKRNGISFEDEVEVKKAGRATLIDLLYKKVSRPKLVDPIFVIHHPVEVSPLARKNDADPMVVDRFQLVVNGWEVVNAYSELIDPVDQAQRFVDQAAARAQGDADTMDVDYDFLLCMEYGMPPISGWGMGIDRIVALLTDAANLREVVLFPLLRPE
ncbi:MAG TPA: lysine--tRNA ligase [Fibrobacteres bacterium]|jgi:lysyl-tRNA synthetase, class II|nr:lysine--tRNA ligase [Fibrobacterota bacterium]